MKAGDKVVCIKKYRSTTFDIAYLEGVEYIVSEIWFPSDNPVYTILYDEKEHSGISFYEKDYRLFKDYFITLTEQRKQKLEKLNDNR
jgi:hypothetical protein